MCHQPPSLGHFTQTLQASRKMDFLTAMTAFQGACAVSALKVSMMQTQLSEEVGQRGAVTWLGSQSMEEWWGSASEAVVSGEIFFIKLLSETAAIRAGGWVHCSAGSRESRGGSKVSGLRLQAGSGPGSPSALRAGVRMGSCERSGGHVSHSEAGAHLPGQLCGGSQHTALLPSLAQFGNSGVSLSGKKKKKKVISQLVCSLAQPRGKSTGQ